MNRPTLRLIPAPRPAPITCKAECGRPALPAYGVCLPCLAALSDPRLERVPRRRAA